MENCNGLLFGVDLRHSSGTGDRARALALADAHLRHGDTLRAHKGYDICRIAYEDSAIVSNSAHHVSVLKRFQAERGGSSRYDGNRRYTLRFHKVAPPS